MSFLRLSQAPGPTAAPPSGDYTYAMAVADAPFSITAPTDPSPSGGSQTVTAATISSHINQSKVLTLSPAAGAFGNIELTGDDQWLICQSGVQISNLHVNGADRIKIVGSGWDEVDVENYLIRNGTDCYLEFLSLALGGTGQNEISNYARVAVLSCLKRMGQYSLYGSLAASDIVVGNCDMQTGDVSHPTPTVRLQSCNRSIIRHSRVANTVDQSCHRIHADSPDGASANHWLADSQMEVNTGGPGSYTPSGGGGASDGSSNIWIDDNHYYMTDGANWGTTDNAPAMTALTMRRNVLHSTGGAFPNQLSGWNIPMSPAADGNVVSATTTAPAWSRQ